VSSNISNKRFITYFQNGSVRSLSETKGADKNETIMITKWFANGQIKSIEYETKTKDLKFETRLNDAWDFEGNKLLSNGNGFYKYYEENRDKKISHEGRMLDGFKEGEWIGKNNDDIIIYKETYKDNKCLTGLNFDENQTIKYTELKTVPEYKDGLKEMYNILLNSTKYPIEAQKKGIFGNVFLQFNVDTNGYIHDIKVLKGIGSGCDEEAMRVVKLLDGNWIPGKLRGKPISTRFTLPVPFRL
jgi:TonB family protein